MPGTYAVSRILWDFSYFHMESKKITIYSLKTHICIPLTPQWLLVLHIFQSLRLIITFRKSLVTLRCGCYVLTTQRWIIVV